MPVRKSFLQATPLTEENIDKILHSDVREVKVRNNNIKGIEVEAITEGSGVIEALRDRIIGRVAAEDIVDATWRDGCQTERGDH